MSQIIPDFVRRRLLGAMLGASLVGYMPAGAGAVATTVHDHLRKSLNVDNFGAVGDWNEIAGTDNTLAFQAALAAAQSSGKTLTGTPGSKYKIANSFVIAGSPLSLDFAHCTVVQVTDDVGFLELRADGCDIENLHVIFVGTRDYDAGSTRYRGYSKWQRMAAVWCESSNNRLKNITANNLNNAVCMRGPVVRNPAGAGYTGAETDPSTAYFYDSLAVDNLLDNIKSLSCDFCITGHQQQGLNIGAYIAKDITQNQNAGGDVPPHAVYMTSPGAAANGSTVFIGRGGCEKNEYGVAHKFVYWDMVRADSLSANRAAGGALFDNCAHVAVNSITVTNLAKRRGVDEVASDEYRYGVYVVGGAADFGAVMVSGKGGPEVGGVLVINGAVVSVDAAKVTTQNPAGAVEAAPIKAEDTSVVNVQALTHVALAGNARHSLVAIGSAVITCNSIKTTGTTKLARAISPALVNITVSPSSIDGYDRSVAYLGNVKVSKAQSS